MGTFQLDFEMPRRLGCAYIGADGQEHVPPVIHRALLGTFERFLGILLEGTSGRLPAFMAPVQLRLVPVADRHHAWAQALAAAVRAEGFRVELAESNERVAAQVRDAVLRRVPLIGVIGDREAADEAVSVRAADGADMGVISRGVLLELLRRCCQPPEV